MVTNKIKLNLILLSAIFTLFLAIACPIATNAGQRHGMHDLPFVIGPDGCIVVNVYLNGKGPFALVVDTGTTYSGITTATAEAVGIAKEGVGQLSGAFGSDIKMYNGTIGQIGFSDITLKNQPCWIFNSQMPFRYDGILAGDIFSNYAVRINLVSDSIRLFDNASFKADYNDTPIPFNFDRKHVPVVDGQIDGKSCRLAVDTGFNGVLELFARFADRNNLPGKVAKITDEQETSLDSSVPTSIYYFDDLILRGEDIDVNWRTYVTTAIDDDFSGDSVKGDYDGRVGIALMQNWIVTFDYAHRHILFRLLPNTK